MTISSGLDDILAEHFGTEPVKADGARFPGAQRRAAEEEQLPAGVGQTCTKASFDGGPLEGLVFHGLRHTDVALAVDQGAHPLAIKQQLGHASIQTTTDTLRRALPVDR